ncbi:MAG: hypothetical protein J7494_06565 [Sphingobium sp.]|nr:hypothetical protein [Sphingobium sp.]
MKMPDIPSQKPETDDVQSATCPEVGLKRAIQVAEEAGLRDYRIEIAPDGTIAIIVGNAPRADG